MKKRYVAVSAMLAGLTAWLYFGEDARKKVKVKKEKPLIFVDTTSVKKLDFEISKGYIGTLFPSKTFEVTSKVAGRIVKMNHDIGDTVKNGAIIAQIDGAQYSLELKQVKGKLKIDQSRVRQKEMQIALAEKEYNRMKALRDKKVISESALEKSNFDYEQAKLMFEIDKANLDSQMTSVEMAELKLSYTRIKAKWGKKEDVGVRILGDRFVDQGATVTPNTTIASIIDIGILEAEIFVGEKEYPHFKSGMKVVLGVDAFPEDRFEGVVERVAPYINEQTRQAKVQIRVCNKDLRLRPGMFARTRVVLNTRNNVPMLPKTCIVEEKEVRGVFVYDAAESVVSFVPVTLGMVRHGKVEILNHTDISLPVVAIGQHMLDHGDRVKHVEKSAEGAFWKMPCGKPMKMASAR